MAEQEKTVPLSALLKAKEEIANLKSEIKMAKANLTDEDEVKDVREYLLERDRELNEREATLEKRQGELTERQTTLDKRDKEESVKSLAAKYKVELDKIKDADDPEKEALKIIHERLTKEKEQPPAPAEEAFESAPAGGIIKKQPKDMDDKEFAKLEQSLKAKYYETQQVAPS
uniref:Uncharacterized protein n=1 Tax=viral metagenome TaxID=1070528 RepID=A0A6H1ZRE2_9ZZZZ